MKRRQLIRYAGTSFMTMVGVAWGSQFPATSAQETPEFPVENNPESLLIQWLGHTCFLFTSDALRVLVNPFETIGCTANYRPPTIETDLVLISSQLLDEGAIASLPGTPKLLYEPGAYKVGEMKVEGIRTYHDREGGRRFGINVAWRWQQGGINILHLGGVAAPITLEQKILMGTPDVALIPVGGGPKAYTPQQAKDALKIVKPKLAIPTHYRTDAADPNACDIVSVDEFLRLMDGVPVRQIDSDAIALSPTDLPVDGAEIKVLTYNF